VYVRARTTIFTRDCLNANNNDSIDRTMSEAPQGSLGGAISAAEGLLELSGGNSIDEESEEFDDSLYLPDDKSRTNYW